MLEAARLELDLAFRDDAVLPPYEGGLLRGAFGYALKPLSCAGGRECPPCRLESPCAYALAFEALPAPPPYDRNADMPKAYVIEPGGGRSELRAGDAVRVGLVLVGRAVPHARVYLAAIAAAGRIGVTRRRARYEVVGIRCLDTGERGVRTLLDGTGRIVAEPTVVREPAAGGIGERLELEFTTPTRITFGGRLLVDELPFPALVQALAVRVSMLDVAHCGGKHEPWRQLVDEALEVCTVSSGLRWQEAGRFSTRRNARDTLSGLVGRICYEGPRLERFRELLAWGEIVHVGKKATFGLGRYHIVTPTP